MSLERSGAWAGGRLLLCKPSSASRCAVTFEMLEDAELLYRHALPFLNVSLERSHGDVEDFLHDRIVHGERCLTAALLDGQGGTYEDAGEDKLYGALTFRLHPPLDPPQTAEAAGSDTWRSSSCRVDILTTAVNKRWQQSGIGSLLVRWVQQHLWQTCGLASTTKLSARPSWCSWLACSLLHTPERALCKPACSLGLSKAAARPPRLMGMALIECVGTGSAARCAARCRMHARRGWHRRCCLLATLWLRAAAARLASGMGERACAAVWTLDRSVLRSSPRGRQACAGDRAAGLAGEYSAQRRNQAPAALRQA